MLARCTKLPFQSSPCGRELCPAAGICRWLPADRQRNLGPWVRRGARWGRASRVRPRRPCQALRLGRLSGRAGWARGFHELPAAVGSGGARIRPASLAALTTAVRLARFLASTCSCFFLLLLCPLVLPSQKVYILFRTLLGKVLALTSDLRAPCPSHLESEGPSSFSLFRTLPDSSQRNQDSSYSNLRCSPGLPNLPEKDQKELSRERLDTWP